MTYWWDFFIVPVYVAALLIESTVSGSWNWMTLNALVAGYVGWVFVEWWIHKVVFHRVYRREHWVHHRRPHDLSVNGQVSTIITNSLIAGVVGVSVAILGRHYGSALAAAGLAGYWTYVVCHHAIHLGWIGPFTPLLGSAYRRHDLHHKGVEVNFNVLCPLADFVLGTLKQVPWSTYDAGKSSN